MDTFVPTAMHPNAAVASLVWHSHNQMIEIRQFQFSNRAHIGKYPFVIRCVPFARSVPRHNIDHASTHIVWYGTASERDANCKHNSTIRKIIVIIFHSSSSSSSSLAHFVCK